MFRDVIHIFISATEDLISARLSPAYHRLSSEEREAIVYYLEELHEFLEQEEASPASLRG
jgi:hypothetical protein